jgi:alcohol dehydrogenase class IV
MITAFNFSATPSIIFGQGCIALLGKKAAAFGNRAILITGGASLAACGGLDALASLLREADISFVNAEISGEPSPESIDAVVARGKAFLPHCVIAIGGGSVLDAGKAVSAMLCASGPVEHYLEDVGKEKPSGKKLPLIALPTTSGTGSEASANAVISRIGPNGFKKSLRHESYVPDIAIVDPALTVGCPQAITASCGMDALTQLIEAYVSTKASAMTDAIALSGMERIREGLLAAALVDPRDLNARSSMALAALFSGIALANAGLGVVHGMAAMLGGRFPVPHGVACGALLGPATAATIKKLSTLDPRHPALEKYGNLGCVLTGTRMDTVEYGCEKLVHTIAAWTRRLKIPALGEYGIGQDDLKNLFDASMNKNNPVHFDGEEMTALALEALVSL